ncbi:MAG: metal-dependent hydrolase [Candidatus Dasytiphilus stammeri]
MTAKGHAIFAIALAIFSKRAHLTPILTHGDWWHIISAAILTSLLPDIDHPRSLLGQHLKWLSASMRVIFGHRGFTHSILALAAAVKIFNLTLLLSRVIIPDDVSQGMIIGYISHLIADSLTPAGIPLLWPLRWKLRFPIILNLHKNNYISERLFGSTLIVISILIPSYYLISLSRHIKIIPIHILQVFIHFFQKYIN